MRIEIKTKDNGWEVKVVITSMYDAFGSVGRRRRTIHETREGVLERVTELMECLRPLESKAKEET